MSLSWVLYIISNHLAEKGKHKLSWPESLRYNHSFSEYHLLSWILSLPQGITGLQGSVQHLPHNKCSMNVGFTDVFSPGQGHCRWSYNPSASLKKSLRTPRLGYIIGAQLHYSPHSKPINKWCCSERVTATLVSLNMGKRYVLWMNLKWEHI